MDRHGAGVLQLLVFVAVVAKPLPAQRVERNAVFDAEVHVSYERSTVPYVESYIAADPNDSDHLIVVAVTVTAAGDVTSTSFSSDDGGRSWLHVPLTGCDVDPWVAFGPDGRAYASCLKDRRLEGIGDRTVVDVFRSADGGRSWLGPTIVQPGSGGSADRPVLAVDQTQGVRRGTVYVVRGQNYRRSSGSPGYGPGISRSTDGGRTFSDPTILTQNNLDNQILDAVVLPDGALAILYFDFQQQYRERVDAFVQHSRAWTVTSDDGGRTFSSPAVVIEGAVSTMAVDPSPHGNGRWYVALTGLASVRDRMWTFENWSEEIAESHIYVMHSDNRGERWSAPTRVNDNRRRARNETPMLAVNNQGVVGVAWYDRRNGAANGSCYDIYFSASVDGGDSFLPNTRITTETSCQDLPGNVVTIRDGENLNFAERWATGADYGHMAAAPDGSFHVLWSDNRTGLYQLWTRRVRVAPNAARERDEGVPPSGG